MALTDEELYYFRQALKEDDREIRGKVKVIYSGGSFNTEDNIRATATGTDEETYMSHAEQVVDNTDIRYNFAGLEQDYFIADGSMVLMPSEESGIENEGVGYIGGINQDTLTINIEENAFPEIQFPGITIYFSENGEYATNLDVTFTYYNQYTEETTTSTTSITNNDKNVLYVQADNYDSFSQLRKVVIDVKSWVVSNHRVRITKVDMGETTMFSEDTIASYSVLKNIDLSNHNLPTDEFTLKIDNYSGDYNFPDMRSSLIAGLTLGIPYVGVNTELGFKYLPLGTFQYAEISNDSSSMATLTFKGCFENMASEGMQVYNETNQYAEDVIDYALSGYNKGVIDLKYNTLINNPQNVNFANLREQLQGLSQYTGSFIRQDAVYPENDTSYYQPTISFFQLDTSRYEEQLSLRNMRGYPVIKFGKGINSIDFSYSAIGDKNTDEKDVIYETSMRGEEVIYNDQDMYGYFVNAQTTSPYDQSSVEIYADGSRVNDAMIQNSGLFNIAFTVFSKSETLKIQAKAYTYRTNTNTSTIDNLNNVGGDKLTVNNGYITSTIERQRVADDIFSIYKDEFTLDTFGDPTLQCGDYMLFEVKGGYKRGFIEKIQIDYNGGLNGSLEGVCTDV